MRCSRFPLWQIVQLICILGLLVSGSNSFASSEASEVNDKLAANAEDFFDVSFGDLQEELELVREENKTGLLVMFETKDCPWCTRMKQQVLNRIAVQDYYHENFRVLALDAEGDVLITDFEGEEITTKEFSLRALRVRATPVFAFFDAEGELITRYTGALKNAWDFLLLGRYVVDGHHATTRFSQYRRENQPG